MMTELPAPDDFGNYWLSEATKRARGPAVLPSKKLVPGKRPDQHGAVVFNGWWLASTGHAILWDSEHRQFRRFSTAQRALDALLALDMLPA